jgi:hypothetical protein
MWKPLIYNLKGLRKPPPKEYVVPTVLLTTSAPVRTVPPRPPISQHHASDPSWPCKGPISILSHSCIIPLSLPLWPAPLLPLARFLAWLSPLSPLVCPSFTWNDRFWHTQ